ncbi:RIO1 family regulatory kinase/ATPase [Nanoarchaeota archaeon]
MAMKEYLAKGKRGITYRTMYKGKEAVVKERNPDSDVDTLQNEYNFLKELNPHGIGPEAYSYEKGSLVMENITGEMIIDYLHRHEKDEIISVLKIVFEQLRIIDNLGINKAEMTYPYKHIIIRTEKPVMIDFERCRKTEHPQNINQFCQFLISKKIEVILESKGIAIDKQKVIKLAKKYKETYSDEDYKNLIGALW